MFCRNCIEKHLEVKENCPECRCVLSAQLLSRCLFAQKHVDSLLLYCPYRFVMTQESIDSLASAPLSPTPSSTPPSSSLSELETVYWEEDEEGCQDHIRRYQLEDHQRDCIFRPTLCPYGKEKCGKVRVKDLSAHYTRCNYRPVTCPSCDSPGILPALLQQHLLECSKVMTNCEFCGLNFQRGELQLHLKTCEKSTVCCPFSSSGCDIRLPRLEMEEHIQSQVMKHMLMMQNSYQRVIEDMRKEIQTSLEAKDKVIQELEEQVASLSNVAHVEWKIEKFATERKTPYLQSRTFSFFDMNWFLGLFTNGDNEKSKGFLSLFLFLEPGPVLNKSVSVEYTLTLENEENYKRKKKNFSNNLSHPGTRQNWTRFRRPSNDQSL